MENNPQKTIDPIGFELALAIFSTTVTVASFLYQIVPAIRNSNAYSKKLTNIRKEIISLQNSIDDLILIFERASNQSDKNNIAAARPTISETMLDLKERDYVKWIDIQRNVESVRSNLYAIIAEVRDVMIDVEQPEYIVELEMVSMCDAMILDMNQMRFDKFIDRLRILLNVMEMEIKHLQG